MSQHRREQAVLGHHIAQRSSTANTPPAVAFRSLTCYNTGATQSLSHVSDQPSPLAGHRGTCRTIAAPQAILDLVERFARNVDLYRSASYNETQARREFIDPFFAALHKQLADAKTLRRRRRGQEAVAKTPWPRSCSSGRRRRRPCRTINAADHQSDWLVYELYGLTEEEIRIVRKGANLG